MTIEIHTTIARDDNIVGKNQNHLFVKINELPIKGKANIKLICILADFFNINKSSIKIIKGFKTRLKLIEIDLEINEFDEYTKELPLVPIQNKLF